jgi:hypothetical protein
MVVLTSSRSGLKGTTYLKRCTELGLETRKARRTDKDMALVHKYMAGQSNCELFNNFEGRSRVGRRRNAGRQDLTVQSARTNPRK